MFVCLHIILKSSTFPLVKGTSLTYIFLLAATSFWCIMIFLAPIASLAGWNELAGGMYGVFGTVCHQLDSHSLHIGVEKLGVCARCTALYVGFFLGVVVYPIIRPLEGAQLPGPKWLMVASIPMLADVILTISRVHAATIVTRLVTGSIFGVVVAFIIVPGLLHSIPPIVSSFWRNHAHKT